MIEKWPVTIPALTGRRKRNVYVYLPEEALAEEPGARFPVLYMFDGHNVFFDEDATYGKSWGMKEYLEASGAPLMVVAVECNHSPRHGRLCEYTPYSFDDPHFGHIPARGKKYMDWLVYTLKPAIDAEYPTLPERETTWIAGSSMGGLMSLYAALAYNGVFSRAACLSPSLGFVREPLMQLVQRAALQTDTILYMDYGSREMAHHPGMQETFAAFSAALLQRGVALTSRIVPGGEHCEACWEEQIPFFMDVLTYTHE